MSDARQKLFKLLADLGIETKTVEHPPMFTVEQSKAQRGEIAGAHTKNLFLSDKNRRLFLVSAVESTPVNLKGLHLKLGCQRLSFGKPEIMLETLGVMPGSVTPFALINDREGKVQFVLDRHLLDFAVLNFHPLENTATTSIDRQDFLRFAAACGHEPLILDLD